MKSSFLAALSAALIFAGTSQAQILRYDLTGLSSSTPPATANATTVAPGLTALTLSRGPGIVGAGLGNGFSANNWNNPATTSGSTSPTLANAVVTGDFFQWGFTVNSGYSASLSTLDLSLRRSAVNASMNFEVQYSFDGFTTPGNVASDFSYFGRSSGTAPATVTPYQWMTTDTAGQDAGNPVSTIDLSTISALQSIAEGTGVTFRLYGYGAATGAADSNTIAIGRVNGPTIGGTLVAVPEPSSFALVGLAMLGCTFRRKP
jgi:hypothetical protein